MAEKRRFMKFFNSQGHRMVRKSRGVSSNMVCIICKHGF
jgi:hypothetical protein